MSDVEQSEKMLMRMRDDLRKVTDLLVKARASKDIVQLNCINDKLIQIKGLLRLAEEAKHKYSRPGRGFQRIFNGLRIYKHRERASKSGSARS